MPQLLSQIVFPDIEAAYYDHDEVQSIMLYVLRHYNHFVDIDRNFRKTLRSLAFLPKSDMLTTIDRFYDPDSELLQKLFLFERNFPSGEYSETSVVAVLREIGLRGVEDVEPEDLLESAFTIQNLYESSAGGGNTKTATLEQLGRKSDALLEYIHRHKSRLRVACSGTGKTLGAAMKEVRWLRALATRPTFYPQSVAWHGTANAFFKPSEMVMRANINVAGSVRPVVITSEVYLEVAKEFGWDVPPPLRDVISHLANVVMSYEPRDKVLFMEMSRSIYTELSKHDAGKVLELIKSRGSLLTEWVWHGDGFTSPGRIAIAPPFMDLRPYVYALPSEMSAFSEFFSTFGVIPNCDLLRVLSTIKDKYDCTVPVAGFPPPRTPGGTRRKFSESEVKRDLHLCISLLNELKSHVTDDVMLTSLQQQLYVPVHSEARDCLKFAPLLQCSYCDDEWLRQGYSTSDLTTTPDDPIVTLVHPNVPTSTAEALGIPTLMSKMLEAEELDYSFGQTDSLTHRLNSLLDEYSDGLLFPKNSFRMLMMLERQKLDFFMMNVQTRMR
jgi:sacsin